MKIIKAKEFDINAELPTISMVRVCEWISEVLPKDCKKCTIKMLVKVEVP